MCITKNTRIQYNLKHKIILKNNYNSTFKISQSNTTHNLKLKNFIDYINKIENIGI